MNESMKLIFSMSVSGSVCILVLFLLKPLLKDRVSRRWQYYIWLIAVARLLLPSTPEVSPVGVLFGKQDQAAIRTVSERPIVYTENDSAVKALEPSEDEVSVSLNNTFKNIKTTVLSCLWTGWLVVALLLLIRKITAYQSFIRYIKAGWEEVSDPALLDRLSQIGEGLGVRRPVELCTNSLILSPLIFGALHPCIVLPDADLPETDFQYTIQHELMHYKRKDLFYKWLVQITVCLHWFNPLVWLMGRELNRACELSCDEAVIRTLDLQERKTYGDVLLRAMEEKSSRKNIPVATLNESAELLKERLSAIMKFKKSSALTVAGSFFLAGTLAVSAAATGAYPGVKEPDAAFAPAEKREVRDTKNTEENKMTEDTFSDKAEQFYASGSLPLFKRVFAKMDASDQDYWLEKIYADGQIAFFSEALDCLEKNDPHRASFAEKAYEDGAIAFFSVLTDNMDETALEDWLDLACRDEKISFQSVLFDALDRDWEKEAWKEELEQQLTEEYQAFGLTKDGKQFTWQGQTVNIFLDRRPDQSFYTLDMNPLGTVNIKVIRGNDGRIQSIDYMTDAEAEELLGDMGEE